MPTNCFFKLEIVKDGVSESDVVRNMAGSIRVFDIKLPADKLKIKFFCVKKEISDQAIANHKYSLN